MANVNRLWRGLGNIIKNFQRLGDYRQHMSGPEMP